MYTLYEIETEDGVYIGVTGRSLRTRLSELRCHRGFRGKISAIATFENRDDALARERELRPNYWMGLNRGKGGYKSGGSTPSPGARNGMAKRVRVLDVEYPTAIAAARAHGLSKTAIQFRLSSPYFSDWVYVTPPHGRYWQDRFARKRRIPAISLALQGRLPS
jgi:hypothetical protein